MGELNVAKCVNMYTGSTSKIIRKIRTAFSIRVLMFLPLSRKFDFLIFEF